jgi:hypothetical protein
MGMNAETVIIDYSFPTKKNKLPFPFAANKWKFAVPFSVTANRRKLLFHPLGPFSVCSRVSTKVDFRSSAKVEIFTELIFTFAVPETWRHGDMER